MTLTLLFPIVWLCFFLVSFPHRQEQEAVLHIIRGEGNGDKDKEVKMSTDEPIEPLLIITPGTPASWTVGSKWVTSNAQFLVSVVDII